MTVRPRSASTLRPSSDDDGRRLPGRRIGGKGESWFRTHPADLEPWWFGSGVGRFNLRPPRGTLNAANSASTSAREALGAVLVGSAELPLSAVEGRVVSCLVIPVLRVADFTDGGAVEAGIVPGDVSGPQDDDYETTRTWAFQVDRAGFDGIVSRSRFGTGSDPLCLYWFGEAGEHVPEGSAVDAGRSGWLHDVVTAMGIRVIRPPSSNELWMSE